MKGILSLSKLIEKRPQIVARLFTSNIAHQSTLHTKHGEGVFISGTHQQSWVAMAIADCVDISTNFLLPRCISLSWVCIGRGITEGCIAHCAIVLLHILLALRVAWLWSSILLLVKRSGWGLDGIGGYGIVWMVI